MLFATGVGTSRRIYDTITALSVLQNQISLTRMKMAA
jgi:hypothetical protein